MSPQQQTELGNILAMLRSRYTKVYFHHGDCKWADEQAHDIARKAGCLIIIHPPTVPTKRAFCQGAFHVYDEAPYLVRNRHIVHCSEWLIAAPHTDVEMIRSGTWSTIRYARSQNLRIHRLLRNGGREISGPL